MYGSRLNGAILITTKSGKDLEEMAGVEFIAPTIEKAVSYLDWQKEYG